MRALGHKPPSRHGMGPADIQVRNNRASGDRERDRESENANVRVGAEDKKSQTKRTCYEKDTDAEERGATRLIMKSCERE